MAFNLDDLAKELGIDLSSAKPEAVTKWNGYLTEADKQYREASAAKAEAEEKLAAIQNENRVINEQIAQYGASETAMASLRANLAQERAARESMAASLETLKAAGFDVTIPEVKPAANELNPNNPAAPSVDMNKITNGFATVGQTLQVMNKYQRIFGKAIPDDIVALTDEALANRMTVTAWADKKYNFAAEESRVATERQVKRDADIAAAAVAKFQQENPITRGNPELSRGVPSRFPQLESKREGPGENGRKFANMSVREKIARSVGSTMNALRK